MAPSTTLEGGIQKKSVRKRPAKQYERPLQVPDPSEPDTPFKDCTLVFSIDVSGSTQDRILSQEVATIEKAVAGLSNEARLASRVIPWDAEAHEIISVDELDRLTAEGGTNPTSMLQSDEHVQVLRRADLWFLLTDGDIDQSDIQAFAKQLGESGLHNKACVLILFGYHYRPPYMANISVGISVFAALPDCIFLFHDVVDNKAYILQSKGFFGRLGQTSFTNPTIDFKTEWKDLSRFDYTLLEALRIPSRQALLPNQIFLQDRRQIDLENVYNGKLSTEETEAILLDQQSLNSVLLTASSRGQHDRMTKWLKHQQRTHNMTSLKDIERKDVHEQASRLIREVVEYSIADGFKQVPSKLQSALRRAHRANWLALATEAEKQKEQDDRRDVYLADALDKLAFVSQRGLNSPVCLSPSFGFHSDSPKVMTPPSVGRYAGKRPMVEQPWTPSLSVGGLTRSEAGNVLQSLVGRIQEQVSFIPGYCIDPRRDQWSISNTCQCCGSSLTSPGLLLKTPPEQARTPEFAQSNSQSNIRYGYVVAGYPETDIISRYVCCDQCAYFLCAYGTSPLGEKICGALPLSVSFDDEQSESRWMLAATQALQSRFNEEDMHTIVAGLLRDVACQSPPFKLAVAPTVRLLESRATIRRADGTRENLQQAAVNFCCRGLFQAGAFYTNRKHLQHPVAELLQHPVESFVPILTHVTDLPSKVSLFFMRFLWQIMDETFSYDPGTRHRVRQYLKSLEPQPSTDQQSVAATKMYSHNVDLEQLVQRGVLARRTHQLFQQDDIAHTTFVNACMPALHASLWKFGYAFSADDDLVTSGFFGSWLEFADFVELCDDPRNPTNVARWAYSASALGARSSLRAAYGRTLDDRFEAERFTPAALSELMGQAEPDLGQNHHLLGGGNESIGRKRSVTVPLTLPE